MELLTPGLGLIFWQTVVFLLLFFLLAKFAWRPILDALKIREESIEEALKSADMARDEMASLKADNEKLMVEARVERDKLLKEAAAVANKIKHDAQQDAKKSALKMIEEAKSTIENEKQAAVKDVKNLVANLSLNIAEKVLRKNLSEDKAQKDLVATFLKDKGLN